MRNRRLLTLAVLAVALGFAAFAQADTAVVTVITDPGAVANSYDIRYSIADGVNIGSASTAPGAQDFTLKSIGGSGVVGELTVDSADIVFGGSASTVIEVTDLTETRTAGFNADTGLRKVTADAVDGTFDVACLQPVAYSSDPIDQNDLDDAAVLLGVGTVGSAGAPALPSGISFVAAPSYDADTLMVSGTYTAGTGGAIQVATFGTDGFSTVPDNGSGGFTGPLTGTDFDGDPVEAIVVMYTTGSGVGGGSVAPTTATTLNVDTGAVVLGSAYASNDQVTLLLDKENTSITLAADKTVGGLDIQTAETGFQTLDVNAATLTVDSATPEATQASIAAMVGDATDGLYSSQVDAANELLVVTAVDNTGDDVFDFVAIKATIVGDATLDGTVNGNDYNALLDNWLSVVTQWSQADMGSAAGNGIGDGFVDGSDYNALLDNWLKSFTPTGGGAGVPEPATMALLAFGGIAVLRRRRK